MVVSSKNLFPLLVSGIVFAVSCSNPASKSSNETFSETNPEDTTPVLTSLARTTGTTMLTNVKEVGIFNFAGRVTCMVIDKADSNHLIAGAATGGLWKSNNRGRTWAPIDDHLPTLTIRSITQNPFQSNIYYASTNTLMANGTTIGYRPDIYKSTDGGSTFQLLPATSGTFTLVSKVVCSRTNANTLYAGAGVMGGGVHRSQDGGQTFTSVLSTTDAVTDIEVLPNGAVLVCAGTSIYRSPNGNPGTYVQTLNGAAGANTFSNMDVSFCESQPDVVYGVTTGGNIGVGVFKSVNGGQSWSFAQSLPSGIFTRAVGVKPNNPNFFFAGSIGLYLSQNAGSSFQFYGVGGVDWWSVNFDPHNPDKVFMTFDQGIVEVKLNPFNPNNNTAYETRDSLLNCAQIYAGDYFPIGDRVVAGMQDLGTHEVFASGTRNVASGDGGFSFYHKQDTTVVYGSYQNGNILKKTSIHIPFPQPGYTQPQTILNQLDGNNDGTVDEGAFFINAYWMNNSDGEQLYYPTKKRLWRSTNGGASWQPISSYYNLSTPSAVASFMDGNNKPNPMVYWSVKDTLIVMPNAKTAVAGNELRVKLPGTVRSIRIDPANDSFVFITSYGNSSGPRIHRSSNVFQGNVQWTDLTGDMPDRISVRSFEINQQDRNQMIAATSDGLYVSSNGGQHWDKDLQFPNVNILRTSIRPSDKRIFIFTYGRGAWAASFPPPASVNDPSAQTTLTVWPNPTKDVLHVAVPQITRSSTLKIWSADGRLQKSVTNLQHTPHSIDIGHLPPGNYVVALYEGNKRLRTAKVVKH